MAFVKSRVMVLLMVMAALQVSSTMAAVYKVGDSAGWTIIGNIDYKKWAASKTFKIGDTIVFQYNTQFHDVTQVSHQDYRSCNATSPLATYKTGNDSITIKRYGHHLFLCGVPGHCQTGQKVDINVRRSSSMGPTPTPNPSAAPSPSESLAPAPSPSNSASLPSFGLLSMVAVGLAIFVGLAY